MKLHEYVYGLFDHIDYTFVEGIFPICLRKQTYNLQSRKVVKLREIVFSQYEDSAEFYSSIKKTCKWFINSIPSEKSLLLYYDYFEEILKKHTGDSESAENNIRHLISENYFCLLFQIDHQTDVEPLSFIKSIRNEKGIDKLLRIFLSVVRDFYNYHIYVRSPHIYVTDIHTRSTNGIFSVFCNDKNMPITNVHPIVSYYEPALEEDAEEKAKIHFQQNKNIPIEDLALARAQVYAERQHFTLSIIHAIIALEVVVPAFINRFLKDSGVSNDAVKDFNNKFGLSVRVKAFLKIILPKEVHKIIDDSSAAITLRNKILHEGLQDASLSDTQVTKLVRACMELNKTLKEYQIGK